MSYIPVHFPYLQPVCQSSRWVKWMSPGDATNSSQV